MFRYHDSIYDEAIISDLGPDLFFGGRQDFVVYLGHFHVKTWDFWYEYHIKAINEQERQAREGVEYREQHWNSAREILKEKWLSKQEGWLVMNRQYQNCPQGQAAMQVWQEFRYGEKLEIDAKKVVRKYEILQEQPKQKEQELKLQEASREIDRKIQVTFNLQKCRKEAESGDVNKQFYFGWMYDKGYKVSENPSEALRWYTLAANSGHPKALFNIAVMHFNGRFGEQNIGLVVEWAMKVVTQTKLAEGRLLLGYLYEMGLGVPQNSSKAFELYSESKDKCPEAFYRLYLMDKIRNAKRAKHWLKSGLDKGIIPAIRESALKYIRKDECGIENSKLFQVALEQLEKAAEAGDRIAQREFATFLKSDLSDTISQAEQLKQREIILHWYRCAAQQNDLFSIYQLANELLERYQAKRILIFASVGQDQILKEKREGAQWLLKGLKLNKETKSSFMGVLTPEEAGSGLVMLKEKVKSKLLDLQDVGVSLRDLENAYQEGIQKKVNVDPEVEVLSVATIPNCPLEEMMQLHIKNNEFEACLACISVLEVDSGLQTKCFVGSVH